MPQLKREEEGLSERACMREASKAYRVKQDSTCHNPEIYTSL